jgi:hypothetical protein
MKLRYKVQFIQDGQGNKTAAIIHIKDFEKLMNKLEDLQDLKTIYERAHEETIPYEIIRKELFGNDRKK